jgi:hypothetical protein
VPRENKLRENVKDTRINVTTAYVNSEEDEVDDVAAENKIFEKFLLIVTIKHLSDIRKVDWISKSDPYVVMETCSHTFKTDKVVDN